MSGIIEILLTDEPVETIVLVSPPIDLITVATDVHVGQGPKGDKGDPPTVSRYDEANASIISGVLTLNAASASTFYVQMDQSVANVVVNGWAANQAQRIHVYCAQDGVGGRQFDPAAWPAGTRWSFDTRPQGIDPGTIESFVLEHLPVGNLIFGMMVGQNYT